MAMPAGKPAAGLAAKLSCMDELVIPAKSARPLGVMYEVAQPLNIKVAVRANIINTTRENRLLIP